MTDTKTCANCGKEMVRPSKYSHKTWAAQRYCGHACSHASKASCSGGGKKRKEEVKKFTFNPMLNNIWTAQEILFLTENYPTGDTYRIAHRLNRSINSVFTKASSMGLKKLRTILTAKRRKDLAKRRRNMLQSDSNSGNMLHK